MSRWPQCLIGSKQRAAHVVAGHNNILYQQRTSAISKNWWENKVALLTKCSSISRLLQMKILSWPYQPQRSPLFELLSKNSRTVRAQDRLMYFIKLLAHFIPIQNTDYFKYNLTDLLLTRGSRIRYNIISLQEKFVSASFQSRSNLAVLINLFLFNG